MKNLLAIVLGGLMLNSLAKAEITEIICNAYQENPQLNGVYTKMSVYPKGDGYEYFFQQQVNGPNPTVIYESSGPIIRQYYNEKPTLMFNSDVISIFQMFGGGRSFADYSKNFSFTFRVEECETKNTSLDGTYEMDILIGGKHFQDMVVIQGLEREITINGYMGGLKGSVTVIDSFSAPLTGTAFCSRLGFSCDIKFDIVANENGKDFKVHYEGRLSNFMNVLHSIQVPIIKGKATLEDGSLLGEFVATFKNN